jgi:soluble lytic murein transglycosylase-like protein
MKTTMRLSLRVGVTVAAVTMMSVSLSGQGRVLSQGTGNEPFGAYDAALAGAADALLSSPAGPAAASVDPTGVQAAGATSAADTGLRVLPLPVLPWSGGGLGSAAARVELLRPVIEPILASHGVPPGIAAALIMVESGGRADALSGKGARGLWQLMPDTARRYGLRVDGTLDERLDLIKASTAAAQYLHDLYVRFGDWRLALAGYNAGEANVSFAILKAHTQDFGRLSDRRMLPLETREYVPRVLGRVSFLAATGAQDIRRPAGATVFALSNQ